MPVTPLIGIVDDDPDYPAALSSLIRSLGYKASCFRSAQDLLASDELHHFTCVISDVHMPSVSGIELVSLLKGIRPGLSIILMSGRLENGLREKALESGATAFFAKPFGLYDLLETLQLAVQR